MRAFKRKLVEQKKKTFEMNIQREQTQCRNKHFRRCNTYPQHSYFTDKFIR